MMSKNNSNKTDSSKKFSILTPFKTLGRWFGRMFMGASKSAANAMEVEALESPSRLAVKAFFRRKLAVGALIILIMLFLLVFIGPAIRPMDVNFVDPGQANIAPGYSMLSVPSGMKGQMESISSFSNFTVGVSKDHTLYFWGNKSDALSHISFSSFPDSIRDNGVYMAAAGTDHVVAVVIDENDNTKGRLVFWGDKNRGQFGYNTGNDDDPVLELPEEIRTGELELSKITQLTCGIQCSAMIYDNHVYYWGNTNNCLSMKRMSKYLDKIGDKTFKKVVFTNFYTAVLCDDGTVYATAETNNNYFGSEDAHSFKQNKEIKLESFFEDGAVKIADIAASKNCFCFLTEDGDILVQGAAKMGEKKFPNIPSGEKVVKVEGGSYHFAAMTDAGKVYLWGSNDKNQCDLNGASCADVMLGSYQTYLVDKDGKLIDSCGLKGYLFGTDNYGRDILTRIIHGGKMTMTIGAVAVIISTVIAIIVGCLSGYFGGWVDMLLMRITEIFAAIPFLPFAMLLSYVFTTQPLSETTKIFIIMIILGILSWTGLAHMIRGQVLAEREKEFVTAAKAMGVKERRIAFKHILPNVISVVLVSVTLDFAGCLLTEAGLSYLGFGVQQPRPTWGNMLNGANNSIVIQNYWWQWVFPALFLATATICINIIGDTLRDVLDPKSTREK